MGYVVYSLIEVMLRSLAPQLEVMRPNFLRGLYDAFMRLG